MDRIKKFLRTLQPKLKNRLISVIAAILSNHLEGLDIKPLRGKKNWFRCRIGNIRIIFVRLGSGLNEVIDIDFRGNIYKDL